MTRLVFPGKGLGRAVPALLLVVAIVMGAPGSMAASPHARAAASAAGLDWPGYGGDPGATRFSPATQVTPANVHSLRLAWSFPLANTTGSRYESTPVVAGGRIFITGPDDTVYALDPVTGRQLWHSTVGFNASSPTNRGVAYGDGSVFLATANAWLIALNAATGKQVWSRQILPGTANSAIGETMAPLFDRGRVIAGVTLGERAGPGFVAAYDGRTGRQDWRFQTIPGPGDPARRTWPKGFDPRGAGGAVWMTPAVDQALNLIYVTVGNPVPDYLGQDRAGANLYTASIVALHADSGRLAWYFQEVHHDLSGLRSGQSRRSADAEAREGEGAGTDPGREDRPALCA